MADLTTIFCGISFPHPLILPSGIAQTIPGEHEVAIRMGAGGITTKSLTMKPRVGNPPPRLIKVIHEGMGVMNSVGLKGPGIDEGAKLLSPFIQNSPVPVIVSIFSTTVSDFAEMTKKLIPVHPHAIELNLSCPNVDSEFGKPLGMGVQSSAAAVEAVKKISGGVPVLAKLTPNIPDIAGVAKACESAGADGIVAINTVGPGMCIDIETKKPKLGAKMGGVSGKIIKPIAVRCVWEIFEAVKIPIIGMGGVSSVEDVVEMMMAGATLVGVGSITYYKGMKVFGELRDGLLKYVTEHHLKSPKELVGVAHENL